MRFFCGGSCIDRHSLRSTRREFYLGQGGGTIGNFDCSEGLSYSDLDPGCILGFCFLHHFLNIIDNQIIQYHIIVGVYPWDDLIFIYC